MTNPSLIENIEKNYIVFRRPDFPVSDFTMKHGGTNYRMQQINPKDVISHLTHAIEVDLLEKLDKEEREYVKNVSISKKVIFQRFRTILATLKEINKQ